MSGWRRDMLVKMKGEGGEGEGDGEESGDF